MHFIWQEPNSIGNFLIGLFVILLVYCFLFIVVTKISKRSIPFFLLLFSFVLSILCLILDLTVPALIVSVVTSTTIVLAVNTNQGDANKFLANPFKTAVAKSGKFGVEKIFDSQELYKRIETAIINLSSTKTGEHFSSIAFLI